MKMVEMVTVMVVKMKIEGVGHDIGGDAKILDGSLATQVQYRLLFQRNDQSHLFFLPSFLTSVRPFFFPSFLLYVHRSVRPSVLLSSLSLPSLTSSLTASTTADLCVIQGGNGTTVIECSSTCTVCTVQCEGDMACKEATIVASSNTQLLHVNCAGDKACMNTEIKALADGAANPPPPLPFLFAVVRLLCCACGTPTAFHTRVVILLNIRNPHPPCHYCHVHCIFPRRCFEFGLYYRSKGL